MKFELPKELGDVILQYLGSRPYGEVFKLIQALQQLKPIEESKVTEALAEDK